MEMNYTEHKGENCIYHERKRICESYKSIKKIVLCCLLKMYKIKFDTNDINEIVVNTLLQMKNNLSSALVFERDCKVKDFLIGVKIEVNTR